MELQEYGFIKEGKVFRKAFLEFEERQVGEVKDDEQQSLNYFTERFTLAKGQVEEVERKINETENKGSYLMKVLHLKETLHEFDALGDFEQLYQTLDILEEQLTGFIRLNRAKNLQIKTALLAEMEEATKSSEWKSATEQVKEIQRKWIRTGAVEDDQKEDIEGQFKILLDAFFERRSEFYADLEKMMKEKEADYAEFLEKTRLLLAEKKPYNSLVETIRVLKEEWKGLGRIKKEVRDGFWRQFQEQIKTALAKSKKEKKAQGTKDRGQGKQSRIDFLKELEKLNEEVLPKANVKELKSQWKLLGKVGKEEMKQLQADFLFVLDQISEKQFLDSLTHKRLKGKATDSEKEKMRIRVLYDLLNRDKAELSTFKENLEKFNTSSGLDQLIEGKLEVQIRKVKVKEAIMEQLKQRS